MRVRRSFVSFVAGAMLALSVSVPGRAQTPDGTTYDGNHDAGGPVHFVVSPQGTRILRLEIEGLAGGGCSWDVVDLSNWGGAIEVKDNAFDATNPDGDRIQGQFPAPFQAEGTVQVRDPIKGCETPPLRWVAVAPVPAQAAIPGEPPAPSSSVSQSSEPRQREPSMQQPQPGAAAAPAAVQAVATGGGNDTKPANVNAGAARFCAAGVTPEYRQSLATLKARLGDIMGDPGECEHLNNANGDTLQQTSRGLAYYRWATGLPTFTDGWRHWALAGGQLIEWEGESPDPPS